MMSPTRLQGEECYPIAAWSTMYPDEAMRNFSRGGEHLGTWNFGGAQLYASLFYQNQNLIAVSKPTSQRIAPSNAQPGGLRVVPIHLNEWADIACKHLSPHNCQYQLQAAMGHRSTPGEADSGRGITIHVQS